MADIYECPRCGKECSGLNGVQIHIRNQHKDLHEKWDEIEEASEADVVEYALMGLTESYKIAAQQTQNQAQAQTQNQNIQGMMEG